VWTLYLELLVAVHGTLVAIMNSGPNGIWPMFLFGFLAVFVITQMHGVGWSRRTRMLVGAGYVLAVVAPYAWLGFGRVNEIVRIPIIEYALVAVLSLLIWGGLAIARAVRRPRTPDPADEESVSA
jgi:hypothetical protein